MMKGVSSVKELTLLMPEEQAALADFLTRLSRRFKRRVLQVILFGSRARGEGDAESDLDVLVVLDDRDWRFHDEVALESFDPSLKHGVLISAITMSKLDYDWHKAHRAPLYRQIEQDGVDLLKGTQL
jgi:predicted nucleotidyltransferase